MCDFCATVGRRVKWHKRVKSQLDGEEANNRKWLSGDKRASEKRMRFGGSGHLRNARESILQSRVAQYSANQRVFSRARCANQQVAQRGRKHFKIRMAKNHLARSLAQVHDDWRAHIVITRLIDRLIAQSALCVLAEKIDKMESARARFANLGRRDCVGRRISRAADQYRRGQPFSLLAAAAAAAKRLSSAP